MTGVFVSIRGRDLTYALCPEFLGIAELECGRTLIERLRVYIEQRTGITTIAGLPLGLQQSGVGRLVNDGFSVEFHLYPKNSTIPLLWFPLFWRY